MPYFVAFFVLPGAAFSNSSLTSFFIQLQCEAVFAGCYCFMREIILAPCLFIYLFIRLSTKLRKG